MSELADNRNIREISSLGTAHLGRLRALALLVVLLTTARPDAAVAQSLRREQPTPEPAAVEAYVHESFTVADGLPVNSVTSLIQSRAGYIWIGTFDGLVRFDGVRFTVFNTANSPGLPSNRIVRIHEARDGALWLVTEQSKLVRFRDGVFTHIAADRALPFGQVELLEDASGTLWVGTGVGAGIVRGDHIVPVASDIIRTPVSALLQRSDGSIWAGTMQGEVYRIHDEKASLVTTVIDPPRSTIWSLQEGLGGTLWIGSERAAWRYDGRLELAARTYAPQRVRISSRTGELWMLTATQVLRQRGRDLERVLDRRDDLRHPETLAVGSDGAVLYPSGPELHREGRRIFTLPPGDGHTGPSAITAVLQDREGSLWLGTPGAGLHRLKLADFAVFSEREGLAHRNVSSVFEDRSGALWVGALEGGTSRIVGERVMRMTPAEGDPLSVLSFLQDRAGRLWLGGGYGLHVCARPGERCVRAAGEPISPNGVRAMHEDPDGALWFGTTAGLFQLQDGRWTRLAERDGAPTATVRAFLRTGDGALWMATNGGGLARYHDGRFTHVGTAQGLPLDLVRALHEDEDGWLWVGTEGRGLARLDPREWGPDRSAGRIVAFRAHDGLFDEGIHQILEDDFGRLWMSTNRGIFWVRRRELLDFAAGRVPRISSISYTERDGLRNREANGGSQPAGVRTRDGRLWFATQDGVAVVNPARIRPNPLPPQVVVEQVTAGGSVLPVIPGAELRLGVDQRDLEIDFTALSFRAPANVRFRYRLEGYDRDWVEAGGRRTAFYTQVPPGSYTFHVIAGNNDGVWNEEGATLLLVLTPRFHETGLFRLLLGMLLITSVAAGVGLRVRALRRRSRELEHLVARRTAELERERDVTARQAEALQVLDRARSRFFANVSHEFRTPLTLTIGPLEDLRTAMDGEGRSTARRQLDMALRNARRLLRLVNQILDIARLEAGQMKLRARPRDLGEFARGVAAAFAAVAEQKRIEFTVTDPDDVVLVWFDADAMEKVLGNLLANAFKFTPDDGEITLEVETGSGVALLRVRDSGPGIPAEHLPHVFERFYQVDETVTRAQPGTGIGLALTRELVELHGGTVAVASDGGAVFTVTLPLGRAHLRPDQLAPEGDLEDRVLVSVGAERIAVPPAAVALEAPDPAITEGDDVTTLLVVDDSADLRAYVRSHFEDRFRVVEAADGTEGITLARQLLPDLVISDVMMPGTDGAELCRTLKEDPETDFIPVILLTARATSDDRVAGLVVGADDYLGKPFSMRELAARVDNLIASRRRLRERYSGALGERATAEEAGRSIRLPTGTGAPTLAGSERPADPADVAFLQRLNAVLDASFDNPDFGVAELADAMFMDRTHLFRRTRDVLQESPSELLRRTRLERAVPLLLDGSAGVGEIAYAVGFNSVSHFCRCFRERFGTSPSSFRERSTTPR